MSVQSNGTDETTTITNTGLSSSPPTTPPPDPVNDTIAQTENPSSSPDRRSDIDEQPISIALEYLPAVTAMVGSFGPRRVKVYELRGEVWVDLGTGFCRGFVENVVSFLISLTIEHCISSSHK
jgi:hypothetical protein